VQARKRFVNSTTSEKTKVAIKAENIIQKVLASELSSVHTKELINIYPAKAAPDKNPSITDLI
jgi:asparagine synthetase A